MKRTIPRSMRPAGIAGHFFCGAFVAASFVQSHHAAEADGVRITKGAETLRVEIDGKLFTEYHFAKKNPRPFLYPILWEDGTGLTRNYPMKKGVAGEETDHIHHRSVWFGHHHVNGHTFWGEGNRPNQGTIVHEELLAADSGKEKGTIRTKNKWVAKDGKVICHDERTIRIYRLPRARMLDFEMKLIASNGDVVFGDDKDAGLAVRVAHSMKVATTKNEPRKGHILNSEGQRDNETWGKRAKWCDYYGPVGDKIYGMAIFDHPENPRHPTWWHARGYGLIAANAFGKRHFERLADKHAGDMKLAAGESVTFRWRILWHEGKPDVESVNKTFNEFAGISK